MGRLGSLAVAMAVLGGCTAILDSVQIKDVAGVLTSSGGSGAPDGGRDLWLLEYALVEPLVVRPYLEPVKVAACWQAWASTPGATDTLLAIGKRRESVPEETLRNDAGHAAQARMGRPMLCDGEGADGGTPGTAAPFFDCNQPTSADLSEALSCSLGVADRRLLAYSVLQVADAISGQQASMWPGQAPVVPTGNYARYLGAIRAALGDAANLLVATPESRRGEIGTLPTLALSGGAANGAFLAGFVYRLLSVREQALAAPGADERRITSHERFGGIVSTSVGSLIGPVMDLYFDDVRSDPTTPVLPRHALLTCLDAPLLPGEEVPKERAVQACALRLLRKYFTRTHDWHLLCMENASVRQLLGYDTPKDPVANALAFDPLRDLALQPFFETFGSHLMSNDLVYEQMSVDVEQRVALALDERACAALPTPAEQVKCLRDNTLASMVEPFLARHLDAVYPAVRTSGPRAIRGQWLDGGLRSGTPARRALQLTEWPLELRGRTAVLALSTHRAQGTPTSLRDTLPALAFDTVGTFADQLRAWELNFTGAEAEVERQEIAVWTPPTPATVEPVASTTSSEVRLTPPTRRPISAGAYPMTPATGGLVDSVVMPENVAFGEPISVQTLGEYSFDPVVMTQLFVEGEMMAIQELDKRLLGLGWYRVRRYYLQHQAEIDGEVTARWAKVKNGPADAAAYGKQADERRGKCLSVCKKGGGTFPKQSQACAETLPNALIDEGSPRLPWAAGSAAARP